MFLLLLMTSLGFAQDVAPKAAEYMDAAASVNHFSGTVLIARNGQPIFVHAYGIADREKGMPNRVDTKFRTGSVTKLFTATAVLMLRDQGKVKLDDSVCMYITGCPDAWRTITIRHLLTHYSGIKDEFTELTQMRRDHKLPAEFIEAIKKHPLESTPGTQFRYSNSGYIVLGGVVSRASGFSYATFLRKKILEPLRLKDTYAETAPVVGEAVGYSWNGTNYQKAEMLDVSGISSAGMVCSTVNDLLRFVEALQNGKLLKPSSVAAIMATPQAEHLSYGWRIDDVNGRKRLVRGGDIEGFAASINDYPDQHTLIVSLSNVGGLTPGKLVGDLAAIAFGESYTVPHERKFIKLSAEDMKPLVGAYRLSSGGTICVTLDSDQLMIAPGRGDPTACKPESTSSCFLQQISDDVTFVRDSAGNVTGIRMGSQMEGEKKSNTEYKQCPALFAR